MGGQETCDPSLKFIELARAVGYEWSFRVASKEDVQNIFKQITNNVGSVFIEVDCKKGARKELGRPKISPKQNLADFYKFAGV